VEDHVSEDDASVIDSIIEDLHERNEFNVRSGLCVRARGHNNSKSRAAQDDRCRD